MQVFDVAKFKEAVSNLRIGKIAEKLNKKPNAVSMQLRNLENIKFTEYLVICDMLNVSPETFVKKVEGEAQ